MILKNIQVFHWDLAEVTHTLLGAFPKSKDHVNKKWLDRKDRRQIDLKNQGCQQSQSIAEHNVDLKQEKKHWW